MSSPEKALQVYSGQDINYSEISIHQIIRQHPRRRFRFLIQYLRIRKDYKIIFRSLNSDVQHIGVIISVKK